MLRPHESPHQYLLSKQPNMHFLLHFFILILVSLFYDQLYASRELRSNNTFSFKVDLINRDSPLSPYYNSYMTPQERSQRANFGSSSHNHHFRIYSTYYYKKDYNVDTNNIILIPNGPEYLMKIAIGTPPVEYTAIADTGSDLVWFQCSPCESCIQQDLPLFDPTKSSTSHTIACNSESCSYPDLHTSCDTDNTSGGSCIYNYKYGDNTTTKGILITDSITLTSADDQEAKSSAFPSFTFGCGRDQQGDLDQADGLIGLGAGPLSLVSQLGPSINYKFSYCLTPQPLKANSTLKFGLDVVGPGVVSTPFTTKNPPDHYYLTLDGISIGDTMVSVGQDMIIDSGTTLTFLESSIYDGVRTAMKGAIKLSPVPDSKIIYDPCYEAKQLGEGFNPPDVMFHFRGADIVLKAANTFISIEDLNCLAMVPTDGDFIFGNIAQVNYEVGYDLQAKQVSFAPKDCTNN